MIILSEKILFEQQAINNNQAIWTSKQAILKDYRAVPFISWVWQIVRKAIPVFYSYRYV